MSVSPKVRQLVTRTLDQSRKQQLDWKLTAEEEVFTAVVDEGQFILKAFGFTEYSPDQLQTSGPPSLGLFSKENKMLIDVLSDDDPFLEEALLEIYTLAKEKALGIQESIDAVLKAFDRNDNKW